MIFLFYGSYFVKMFVLSKSGIKTDRMGRGSKAKKTFIIEIILKYTTFLIAVIQLISIIFVNKLPIFIQNNLIRGIGIVVALLGVIIFITAIITMRDSWRAGIDNTQKTKMIYTGIYKYSRNPAFLGFDLLYIGIGLAFSNIFNLMFTAFSISLFHLRLFAVA